MYKATGCEVECCFGNPFLKAASRLAFLLTGSSIIFNNDKLIIKSFSVEIGTSHGITELKRAVACLTAQAELIDNVDDAIIVTDKEMLIA